MNSPLDSAAVEYFAEAVAIMRRLRSPDGCPWDLEQTFASLRPHTLEEVYEVFDAIDRRNWPDLCDELGDLLLQVLFYSQIAADEGSFSIGNVIAGLNRKLIRRHPHVFGEEAAANRAALTLSGAAIGSAQVLRNWEAIKRAEKSAKDRPAVSELEQNQHNSTQGQAHQTGFLVRENPTSKAPAASTYADSALDSVSRAMPALSEARKLGARAQKNGFDWPEVGGPFDKLEEEILELRQAIAGRNVVADVAALPAEDEVAQEIGDLLFTVVNLSRHLKVDPEFALRQSSAKFRRRFAFMESHVPGSLDTLPLGELELLWNEAKKAEMVEPKLPGGERSNER